MRFIKMHGLGNDFVMVEDSELPESRDLSSLAVKVCDRKFGIGADGLMVIGPDPDFDIYMRIFNSDGSEAEMCGNGIRCIAKYAWEQGLVRKETIAVKTLGGPRYPELIFKDGQVDKIRVDMGEPVLIPQDIPVVSSLNPVIGEKIAVDGRGFTFTAVSMGNPHAVVFVDSLEHIQISNWGPLIEVHNIFPRKTNVEFAEILNRGEIKMRVWERGAGETLACGTGTCATLVAAVLNDKTDRQAMVHLKGGDLFIEWSEANNRVYMTGPATEVFRGEF
ncbi:MAG: diaminopimelate epimerase [Chitinophagales bacterium]